MNRRRHRLMFSSDRLFVLILILCAVMLWLQALKTPSYGFEREPSLGFDLRWTIGQMPLVEWRGGLISVGSLLLGAIRAKRSHPVWNGPYATWLQSTPWTHPMPLPLGPVRLGLKDAALMAAATALAWPDAALHLATPMTCFGLGYLVVSTLTFTFTQAAPYAWALAVGLPLLLELFPRGFVGVQTTDDVRRWLLLAVVAALNVVAWAGVGRSLAAFPWTKPDDETKKREALDAALLGWPFGRLGPRTPTEPIRLSQSLAASGLIGWWLFAAIQGFGGAGMPFKPGSSALLILAAGLLALIRLMRYANGFAWPVSPLHRIVSGRLIVPGYDQIFVAPIAILLFGFFGPSFFAGLGFDRAGVFAASIAVMLFLSLAMGPTIAAWDLTGDHRMIAGAKDAASKDGKPGKAKVESFKLTME